MQKTSCIAHEPLSKLEENGSASILNREMRQNEIELAELTPKWEVAAARLAEIEAKE